MRKIVLVCTCVLNFTCFDTKRGSEKSGSYASGHNRMISLDISELKKNVDSNPSFNPSRRSVTRETELPFH